MTEEMTLACFQMITYVGTARSCFINAIQCAKTGDFAGAAEMLKQGDDAFVQGHQVHSDLAGKEAEGQEIGLLTLHAEDQMMSAEAFRTIAEEFIDVYKRMASSASALTAPTETATADGPSQAKAASAASAPQSDSEIVPAPGGGLQFSHTIQDSLGIHARPAGRIVQLARTLDSEITIAKQGGGSAGATKAIALMKLGAKSGDTILVTVRGSDETASAQAVQKLLDEIL